MVSGGAVPRLPSPDTFGVASSEQVELASIDDKEAANLSTYVDTTTVGVHDPLMPGVLPESVRNVSALNPKLGAEIEDLFSRLARAGEAMVWGQKRLPRFIAAGPSEVLGAVVEEAKTLTGAPMVWALKWKGDPNAGPVTFEALARQGTGGDFPGPDDISRTVVGRVTSSGRPAWSDDAAADARFAASHSVQSMSLRSVGCVPIGTDAVLYLYDPEVPGRFGAEVRARLSALCALAVPFLKSEAAASPRRHRPVEPVPGLVGESPAMGELFDAIRAFAPMPWPVLVLGETGSGKEGVAGALHHLSTVSRHEYLAVNCGAIPEELAESTLFGHERGAFTGADRRQRGYFERAGSGTVFLDEVGELSARSQVKLLRLLQEGTYERVGGTETLRFTGRIVAATNRAIDDAQGRGQFREDLYHRLAACVIRVPPLRDRPGDIEVLAMNLLERANAELPQLPDISMGQPAVRLLSQRSWPGNVRDLQNAIRGAVARCAAKRGRTLLPEHFGAPAHGGGSAARLIPNLLEATEAFQKERVERALLVADGNRTQAAKDLGVSRQWLHRLLARWGA
mgnify:CR=1 FL=1